MIDLQDLSDDDLLKKFENGIYEVAKRSSVTSLNYPIFLAEHVDDCREDLKRRLSERNQWQPIETAPKDGSSVDLFVIGRGRVPDCHYGMPYYKPKKECFIEYTQDGFECMEWQAVEGEITHWQALPIPPKED